MAPTRPLAVALSFSWRWTRPTGKVNPALAERETGFFLSPVAPLPAPSVPYGSLIEEREAKKGVNGTVEERRRGGRWRSISFVFFSAFFIVAQPCFFFFFDTHFSLTLAPLPERPLPDASPLAPLPDMMV